MRPARGWGGPSRVLAGLAAAAALGLLAVGAGGGGGGGAAELGQRQGQPGAVPGPIRIEGELDAKDLAGVAQSIAKQAGLQNVATGPAVCGPGGCAGGQGGLVRRFIAPSNLGGPFGAAVQGAIGSVGRQIAGNVLDSWLSPHVLQPLYWRNTPHGYQSTGIVAVPNVVPPPPDGLQTPVQLNTEVVFPRPKPKTRTIFNPCSKAGAAEETGCSNGQKDMYDERDMATRVDAVRKRADERLADSRKNWEDEVLAVKQRLRERVQGLKQRSDAVENEVRRLEAGGGRRMDLPQYVRVRNRVAGVSDAVAKLIADDNLLQERMDHVLEAPGPRGRAGQMGVQGARGMQGVPGPRGLTGAKGNAGLPGRNGDNGPQGPPGPPGVRGRPGAPGLPGANGPAGPPGYRGDMGLMGPEGKPGYDGANGVPGIDGKPGLPGRPGKAGKNGVDGRDGDQGAVGPPGANGVPGPPGRNGPPGLQGLGGPVGPQGPQGPAGPSGLPGPNGAPGIPGPRGDRGPRGPEGRKGFDGRNGREGAPGAPRLEIEPPSPPLPVPAPPGTLAPGVQAQPRAERAYTPEEYSPIIASAIAQAAGAGCGCVAAAPTVVVKERCPCVQQHLAALRAGGGGAGGGEQALALAPARGAGGR